MTDYGKPYGCIYVTTNLLNGMRYVGQKKINHAFNSYMGSGVRLTRAIKKYGKENFRRTIISFAYSPDELNQQEVEAIRFFNAAESDDYYNIELGGMKYPLSEHTKQLISKNHADMRGKKSPCYGKKLSEEQRRMISERQKGRVPSNKGKPMSEEQKAKLRDAWKRRTVRVGNVSAIKCVETGKEYQSVVDAARDTGLVYESIFAVLSGRRNSLYGYHFIYI